MKTHEITIPLGHNVHDGELLTWGTHHIYSHMLITGVRNSGKTRILQETLQRLDKHPTVKKILYYSANEEERETFIANTELPYENFSYYSQHQETAFFRSAYDLMNSRYSFFDTQEYHQELTLSLFPVFIVIDDFHSLSKDGQKQISDFVRYGRAGAIKVITTLETPTVPLMPGETKANFGFRVNCFKNKPIVGIEHFSEYSAIVPARDFSI